ncbi:MAG: TIGR00282 family metallophosphoesterase [Candidatus Doudnabacteria bacterium]|nr:TIGR00282 family metallophosphoesterase [Candidatus Doudnabacteria bacterium]
MQRVLFIGDVVGKPGRKILAQVLPELKKKYKPDAVIVNVENLAHGKGVTPSTLAEIDALGMDCFTSGNHIFDKAEQIKECFEKYPKLVRPANLEGHFPGFGYYRFSKKGQQYLVLNLHGQAFCEKFFGGNITNPFLAVDNLLKQEAQKGDIIIIDFHAEATSEKKTFGYYVDGRVAVVIGTHTHIATADAHIQPKGTAYITDAGMTGSRDSALGTKFQNALVKFLDPNAKFKNELEEEGVVQVSGVFAEVNENQRAEKVEHLYFEITN